MRARNGNGTGTYICSLNADERAIAINAHLFLHLLPQNFSDGALEVCYADVLADREAFRQLQPSFSAHEDLAPEPRIVGAGKR